MDNEISGNPFTSDEADRQITGRDKTRISYCRLIRDAVFALVFLTANMSVAQTSRGAAVEVLWLTLRYDSSMSSPEICIAKVQLDAIFVFPDAGAIVIQTAHPASKQLLRTLILRW